MRYLALLLCTLLQAQSPDIPVTTQPGSWVILTVEARTDKGAYRPLRMVLDTGATSCVVDRGISSDLVNGKFEQGKGRGFGGMGKPVLARTLKGLRLGVAEQDNVPVLVMDLEEVNRWRDDPVDGLLGMSFLMGRIFMVDPQRGILRWNVRLEPSRTIAVTLSPSPHALVKVGNQEHQALLDTGASGALAIPTAPPGSVALSDCDMGWGVDGIRKLGHVRLDIKVFGDHFTGRMATTGAGLPIIGAPFLLAGPTWFDFSRNTIGLPLDRQGRLVRLKATLPEWISIPVCWNRKGTEAFLELSPMLTCSPWYQAGFREGDRVEAVGPSPVSTLTLTRINEIIRDGSVLEWRLQRKKQVLALKNPKVDRREFPPLDTPADPAPQAEHGGP